MVRKLDARMIHGLPDPADLAPTLETLEWMRVAMMAMAEKLGQPMAISSAVAEPGAPYDDAGVRMRLSALEARPAPIEPSPFDASDILARLAALEAREDPPAVIMDPLDPAGWSSLDDARAALMILVTREAARRVGHPVVLYERMVYIDALGPARTDDQNVELLQHHGWALERAQVESARQNHMSAIQGLASLDAARIYDVRANWPDGGAP